ncbi:hypothetical protein ACLMJK_009730 [Lecanora helva]
MTFIKNLSITSAVLISLAAVLYTPLKHRVEVLGISRPLEKIVNIHGDGLEVVPDTLYTEDLHYHQPSGLLFGASEEKPEGRWNWFPPIAKFNTTHSTDHGTIVVINPSTKTTTRLHLHNFPHPFITHGIDIHTSPTEPSTVLIYAINHLANPAYVASNGTLGPAARSQIEIFSHTLGTDSATHLRSIYDPLIRTPNDIYAIDDKNLYVTNDHYYRSGALRLAEDIGFDATPWSDVVHISLSTLSSSSATDNVLATVALSGIQNPNGLGHAAPRTNTVLINRAAAGIMELAHPSPSSPNKLQINSTLRYQMPCTVDNPSYYTDPYAKITGRDDSGYVLPGLLRAAKFPSERDPVVVWFVQRDGKRRVLFQDDGRGISSVSTAVLVGIDPKENGGRKQAWLYVMGPVSVNAVRVKVEL